MFAFVSGIVIGAMAGLLGVGGGEFRIPVLLYLLRDRPRSAAAVNLLVGTFTVIISLARRWSDMQWHRESITLAAVLAVASVIGGVAGARYAIRMPQMVVRRGMEIYMVAVGAWMIFEGLTRTERVFFHPTGINLLLLGGAIALFVAIASAAIGVAGGELRIPALLYFCAIPLRAAGTLSLVASLPTVVAGGATYRAAGELRGEALRIALLMAAGSVIGVIVGAYFLPRLTGHTLKLILGIVVLAAAGGLIVSSRGSAPPAA